MRGGRLRIRRCLRISFVGYLEYSSGVWAVSDSHTVICCMCSSLLLTSSNFNAGRVDIDSCCSSSSYKRDLSMFEWRGRVVHGQPDGRRGNFIK